MALLLQHLLHLQHLFVFVEHLVVSPLRDELALGPALLLEADDAVGVGREDDRARDTEFRNLHARAAGDAFRAKAADIARADLPGLHAARHLRDGQAELAGGGLARDELTAAALPDGQHENAL